MSLTLGTSITLTTGTIKRQFGDFSMQLDFPNLLTGFTDGTMTVSQMPTLKQDFDIQESGETLQDFYMNLSEIEFSVFDTYIKTSDGSRKDLMELINDLSLSEGISVQVTTPTGTDYFVASKGDIKYDWRRREVSFKANSALRYDNEVTGYDISGALIDVYDNDDLAGSPKSHVFPKDVITQFLNTQGSSPNKIIVGHFFDYNKSDNQFGGAERLALGITEAHVNEYTEARDFVTKMAVTEGAFFGYMMGYAFYVRRNYNTTVLIGSESTSATISASDLRDYQLTFYKKSVRNYDFQLDIIAQNQSASYSQYLDTEVIDVDGDQDIDILYSLGGAGDDLNGGLWNLEHDFGQSRWERDGTYTDTLIIDMDSASGVGTLAKDAYKRALGIEQPYKVSFEIFGINTLKPFQFITFDTDINPALNDKKLRPSSLEYNLEEDVIIGEGYFI